MSKRTDHLKNSIIKLLDEIKIEYELDQKSGPIGYSNIILKNVI